jgi:hypothetical protein
MSLFATNVIVFFCLLPIQECHRYVPEAAESRWLLSVSLGDLADQLGPAHVYGPVNLASLRSRIVLEDNQMESLRTRRQ